MTWHTLRVIRSIQSAAGRFRRLAAVLIAVLATSGCLHDNSGVNKEPVSPQLTFAFHRISGPGLMDQQMEIMNHDSLTVVPRLRYTPVDGTGAAVDGVVVTTAYGSNEGKLVVPARQTSYDVLAFTGPDAAKVADVRVDIETLGPDPGFPAQAQLVQP
jgi:hypothetical protein